MSYVWNAWVNRTVFSYFLNCTSESMLRSVAGSVFHNFGPCTEKLLSAKVLYLEAQGAYLHCPC
jgi:hypothetical protein